MLNMLNLAACGRLPGRWASSGGPWRAASRRALCTPAVTAVIGGGGRGGGGGGRAEEEEKKNQTQTKERTGGWKRGAGVRAFKEIPHTGRSGWLNLLRFWREDRFRLLHKHMERTFNTLGPIYREHLGTHSSVNIMMPGDIGELFRSEGLHPRRMTLQPWATHREIRQHQKGVFLKEVMMSGSVQRFLPLLDQVAEDFSRMLRSRLEQDPRRSMTLDPSPDLFPSCHVIYGERIGLFSSSPSQESQRFIWAVERMLSTTPPLLYLPPRLLSRIGAPLWTEHATAWDHIFSHAEARIQKGCQRLSSTQGGGSKAGAAGGQYTGVLDQLMEKGQLSLDLIKANTAVPLQFALYELGRNPQVQEKVRQQVRASWAQAGGDPGKTLQGAPLLKGTVKEILRLHSSTTMVQACLYPLGRSPKIFHEPQRLDPTRQCVGRRIAENEMQLFLMHGCSPLVGALGLRRTNDERTNERTNGAFTPLLASSSAARLRRYSELMALPDSFIQRQQLDASMADTFLEHLCLLDINQEPITARNTSIICTIGPASRSVPKLQEMIKAGMNIARLNFSHGSHEYHGDTIKNVREAVETITTDPLYYRPVAIALDTKGPEIRTGLVKGSVEQEVQLEKGAHVRVVTSEGDRDHTDGSVIWVDYPGLPTVIQKGGQIYIDDGLIELKVIETGPDWVDTVVEAGGVLCSRKGVNLPGCNLLDLPSVSERDEADLRFGVAQGVDMVFASFIRSAHDVREVRRALGPHGHAIKIISKVENRQGVQNFDEILAESDGVMVARGDLGIEIPAEKVFIAQKMMTGRCNSMLESMVSHPRPTRAEGGDVANAVLDGADCVMLSGETAKGLFPICREAEAAIFHQRLFEELRRLTPLSSDPTEVTAIGAVESSFKCCAGAIIVLTSTGRSAHLLSRYRPRCPIIAVTRSPQVARQSQLLRGVFPALFHPLPAPVWADDVDNRVNFALDIGKARGFFKPGDMVIIVTGWIPGSGHTNIMRAVNVT
ncbi:hypothetical protein NHX12_001038 [Muraenolepis orangiensis]|uniref:Pyruvate kinase n=1 Tax=Muraenolepis orangiensis TaxID=630683 RepID=A0A9Q0E2A9_9TELE|nr:hypothetical protein NHX12_001038 [Muraenolepis orangiensis]